MTQASCETTHDHNVRLRHLAGDQWIWRGVGASISPGLSPACAVEGRGVGALDGDTRPGELEWSATFESDGIPGSEAAEMLEGAFAANCLVLKQFMEC